jgi:CheY-like chemotaxis protein
VPQSIHTDPTRLRQILLNLVGNAIKFTESGSVRIMAGVITPAAAAGPQVPTDHERAGASSNAAPDTRPARMWFKVIDTGIGMDSSQVHRLFQAFTQADSSMTRKFGGTGLGLAISRRLAQMLGGDITVQSERGCGSTFVLSIDAGSLQGVPMVDGNHEAAMAQENHAQAAAAAQLTDARILLAEDGPDNQRLISFHLKKAGAAVVVADNGRIAVDKALAAWHAGQPFDMILMDIQMPELDGYAATAQLRAAGYCGPILALTAHAMSDDRDKCLRAGCDDHISKPVERQQLLSIVRKYMDARRTAGNAA